MQILISIMHGDQSRETRLFESGHVDTIGLEEAYNYSYEVAGCPPYEWDVVWEPTDNKYIFKSGEAYSFVNETECVDGLLFNDMATAIIALDGYAEYLNVRNS